MIPSATSMENPADVIAEAKERGGDGDSRLNAAVAASVAIAATFMAICNVKDGNIVQAMQQKQTLTVDAWSYFQAKSTKQALAEAAIDQLTALRDASSTLTPEQRAALDKRIADHVARVKKYDLEKEAIKKEAEGHEKEFERLNVHDDQFDMAEASISVSLALFGVTALTQKRWLFVVATLFCGFGFFVGLAGFLGFGFRPEWLAKLLG